MSSVKNGFSSRNLIFLKQKIEVKCLQKNYLFTSLYQKKIVNIVKKNIDEEKKHKNFCLIFLNKKDYILSFSMDNQIGQNIVEYTQQRSFTKHAEICACEKFFNQKAKNKVNSCFVFSLKLAKNSDTGDKCKNDNQEVVFTNSKPCLNCYNYLLKKGFKNIFFTDSKTDFFFYKLLYDTACDSVVNEPNARAKKMYCNTLEKKDKTKFLTFRYSSGERSQ